MPDDYIKRSDAIFALCGNCEMIEACGMTGDLCDDVKRIEAIHAADVEPKRKTGRWIRGYDDVTCSVCNEILCGEAWEDLDPIQDIDLHYCPNCGAKMDKEEEDG